MGITTILWYTVAYTLCFSSGEGGITGNLDMAFLQGIDASTPFVDGPIPLFVFIAYPMMFAIITPALITGEFANTVTPANEADRYGDIFVDTAKSRAMYAEWKAKTIPPKGTLRRPLWFNRPLKPVREAYDL